MLPVATDIKLLHISIIRHVTHDVVNRINFNRYEIHTTSDSVCVPRSPTLPRVSSSNPPWEGSDTWFLSLLQEDRSSEVDSRYHITCDLWWCEQFILAEDCQQKRALLSIFVRFYQLSQVIPNTQHHSYAHSDVALNRCLAVRHALRCLSNSLLPWNHPMTWPSAKIFAVYSAIDEGFVTW